MNIGGGVICILEVDGRLSCKSETYRLNSMGARIDPRGTLNQGVQLCDNSLIVDGVESF